MNINEVLKKNSPLTEASFYILISLADPLHGYGIMQKVRILSKGRLQLGPGTLYGALSNLQSVGLITGVEGSSNLERRKVYQMTTAGRELAEYEILRLEEMAQNGRRMLESGENQ
jgi:DNA-binding PadR family transcriptional regulator